MMMVQHQSMATTVPLTWTITLDNHLRCFDTIFLGPYLTFKIGSSTVFISSDQRDICPTSWFWIELKRGLHFVKIDISMTKINKNPQKQ